MDYGFDTTEIHLDQTHDASGNLIKVTEAFNAWFASLHAGNLAAFAGRNFLGGKFVWGHGEATNELYRHTPPNPSGIYVDKPELIRSLVPLIAPVQAPLPDRQIVPGDFGYQNGVLDASALCHKLVAAIQMGQLSLPASHRVYVYLAVEGPLFMSTSYWAGWANTVWNAMVSWLDYVQPFWPCIRCPYVVSPSGGYILPDYVKYCLDHVGSDYPSAQVRSAALWADAPDPIYCKDGAVPDWTRFPSQYQQPFQVTSTITLPIDVPVVLWRYAQYSDAEDPSKFAGGQPVALDVTNDAYDAMTSMLGVQAWNMTRDNAFYRGIDTDQRVDAHVTCLTAAELDGNALTFVGRYYRTEQLTDLEVDILSSFGISVVGIAEVGSPTTSNYFGDQQKDGTWKANDQGLSDGKNAFEFAMGRPGKDKSQPPFGMIEKPQPPYTAIYFTADYPADQSQDKDLITSYVANVLKAYTDHLSQHPELPYLIGMYGPGNVLEWCYEQGIVSCFYQAGGAQISYGNLPSGHWPWGHNNLWQYKNDQEDSPGKGYCGLEAPTAAHPNRHGVDFDASWGDEGAWHRELFTVTP